MTPARRLAMWACLSIALLITAADVATCLVSPPYFFFTGWMWSIRPGTVNLAWWSLDVDVDLRPPRWIIPDIHWPNWRFKYDTTLDSSTNTRPQFVNIQVPLWLIAAPFGAISAFLWLHVRRRSRSGHCSQCGYDLTGITTAPCPECGLPPVRAGSA